MPNPNYDNVALRKDLGTRDKLRQLAELIQSTDGRPCPDYFAADLAIREAIERRKPGRKPKQQR